MKKMSRYELRRLYKLKKELLKMKLEKRLLKQEEKAYLKLERCR